MTERVRLVSDGGNGYYVREEDAGNPDAPRYLPLGGGKFTTVDPRVADWLCRAWDHVSEMEVYASAVNAFNAVTERLNAWDDAMLARFGEAEERSHAAERGRYGMFNPLGLLTIGSDWREMKAADADMRTIAGEAESHAAVVDRFNAHGVQLNTWADQLRARSAQLVAEQQTLGNPPEPEATPWFAYRITGRRPVVVNPPPLPSVSMDAPAAPSVQAVAAPIAPPPEPNYHIPATQPVHQTEPTPAPPPGVSRPAPSAPPSSNPYDDLI